MKHQASDTASAYMNDFYKYVNQYRKASEALSGLAQLFPEIQVRGLLVELALKTYLCARGIVGRKYGEPGHGHKLNDLAKLAVTEGLTLTQRDVESTIPDLHELYCQHDGLGENYLCRYPMPNRPLLVSVTPGHETVDEMVKRIIAQAQA